MVLPDPVTALLLILLCLMLVKLFHGSEQKHPNFPPGPKPLPFIGNLHMLNLKRPQKTFIELAKKYGSVFSVQLGAQKVVVLCGYETVKDALVNHAEEFSDRASVPIFKDISSNGYGIVFANGDNWKTMRRFAVSTLKDYGMGKKTIENKIIEEGEFLLKKFKSYQGKPFENTMILNAAVANIIVSILLGHRFNYEDPVLLRLMGLVHENTRLLSSPMVAMYNTFHAVIRWLPGGHRTVKQNNTELRKFIKETFTKYKEELDVNDQRNLIDTFLTRQLEEKPDTAGYFHNQNLTLLIANLFSAGMESTSSTLQWGILLMMKYPEIQKNVQNEIEKVIGSAVPQTEHRREMPYTDAVIHEIQRFGNIVPMNLPHATTQDVTFRGYFMPKGTFVIPLLESVLRDEGYFKKPEEFYPQHFLDSNGCFFKNEAFMPFSAGKRSCAGENLAKMELFLFFTTLLQNFTFQAPPGAELDLTPAPGLATPPMPYYMCAVTRRPEKHEKPGKQDKSDKSSTQSSGSSKSVKKCAICSSRLSSSTSKKLCQDCTNKLVKDESPVIFKDLMGWMRSEMSSAIKEIKDSAISSQTVAPSPVEMPGPSNEVPVNLNVSGLSPIPLSRAPVQARRSRDSEVEGSQFSEGEISALDEISEGEEMDKTEKPQKFVFSTELMKDLLTSMHETMGIKSERKPLSPLDQMYEGLADPQSRFIPVHSTLKTLIKKEWQNPEKRAFWPKSLSKRYPFSPDDQAYWGPPPKLDPSFSRVSRKSDLMFEDFGNLKDPIDKKMDNVLQIKKHIAKKSHGSSRTSNLCLSGDPVGTVPCEISTNMDFEILEQVSGDSRQEDHHSTKCKDFPYLVATSGSSISRSSVELSTTEYNHNRCQFVGLGSPLQFSAGSRIMEYDNKVTVIEQQGVASSMASLTTFRPPNREFSCQNKNRQQERCSFPEQAGGHEESTLMGKDGKDPILVGEKSFIVNCDTFKGNLKPLGGLPQQEEIRLERVVTRSGSFSAGDVTMGLPRSRPVCKESECEMSAILCPVSRGPTLESRRLLDQLGRVTDVCISSNSIATTSNKKDYSGQGSSNPDSSTMAKKTMVHVTKNTSGYRSDSLSSHTSLAVPGSSVASEFKQPSPFSLEAEWGILKSKGFSDELSETLIQSRKKVTRVIYQKAWRVYNEWCSERSCDNTSLKSVLEFLQCGYKKGLSISTLKVQVSALSVFLERRLAEENLILRFFQALKRLKPAIRNPAVMLPGPADPVSIILLVLLCLFLVKMYFYGSKQKLHHQDFPPGPKPLPIIGNIHMLDLKMPYKTFFELAKQYGPVYSIHIGTQRMVMLCGYDTVKDALVNHAEIFSERPSIPIFQDITKGYGILFSNGEIWKTMRRFTISTLRDYGMGKKIIENKIIEECEYLVKKMKSFGGKPFESKIPVNSAVANIIVTIILGHRCDYEDPMFLKLLHLINENITLSSSPMVMLYNTYHSVVRWLPGAHNTMKKNSAEMRKFVVETFMKHKDQLDKNDQRNLIDTFLVKQEEEKPESAAYFHNENLTVLITNLFTAGMETTSTTLRWGLMLMAKYPEIQKNVQNEIEKVIGSAVPQTEHRRDMPYTEAVIHEIQRFSNIIPTNVPHATSQDVVFKGYFIPKGTYVMPLLTSVLRDKGYFEKPDEFHPKHFLDSKGRFWKNEAFLPFSAGKRSCAGENLAKMELFLFLTTLLQNFTFQAPPGTELHLTPGIGFTTPPIHHEICAVPRT
ncbi:uncharacterized protein [Hyperolius riggenbachi]|uniref:uncharacterized protein n=1 Tax=Hyperolius riggenbachi TaxID=752182 RepID=UPI0035A307CC